MADVVTKVASIFDDADEPAVESSDAEVEAKFGWGQGDVDVEPAEDEDEARSLRFNPHHGADGKFAAGAGGAAKRIGKTVAFAKTKGVDVDPAAGDAIRASKGDKAGNIPAVYHATTKKIYINEDHPYWADPGSLMGPAHKSGWMSSSSGSHVVVHEIGHAEHHKKLGDDGYQKIRQRQWTDAERSSIAGQVSQYGRTKPIELVAEVYAGRQAGHKYSKEIDALYDDLGGP